MLTQGDRERIEQAVAAAERGTTGEIVCIVCRRASSYRSFALAVTAAGGLAIPIPLLLLTNMSAERIYVIQLVVTLLIGLALLWLPLRLALVPRALFRMRAREAAHRHFAARGLAQTAQRTGVLIFIAASEHYAEIIADEGISSRVTTETWRETLTELVEALRADRPGDGLVQAVTRVGAVLAQHHPAQAGDVDELPNRVIEL